ncbi:hypothetical protein [Fulvimarina endophytica]|uniref:hypothetical protein n=1 Tax=Fulvimarina endophytica TaxID=2293836 RepID=UPI0018F680A6|nr:hypothetical protein [Fulvimarina endophytica]
MSKVYFPIRYVDVPASPPHGGNPAYRVSFGLEHWADGSPQYVYKVQMAYNGAVAGRKSPSYPEGTDDLERVLDAMKQIKKGEGKIARGMIESAGNEPGVSVREAHQLMRDE